MKIVCYSWCFFCVHLQHTCILHHTAVNLLHITIFVIHTLISSFGPFEMFSQKQCLNRGQQIFNVKMWCHWCTCASKCLLHSSLIINHPSQLCSPHSLTFLCLQPPSEDHPWKKKKRVKAKFTREKGSEQVPQTVHVLTFTGVERASSLLSSQSVVHAVFSATLFPSVLRTFFFLIINTERKSSGSTGAFSCLAIRHLTQYKAWVLVPISPQSFCSFVGFLLHKKSRET